MASYLVVFFYLGCVYFMYKSAIIHIEMYFHMYMNMYMYIYA